MTATQRRGRKIMMTPGELDEFLTTQRTCRVATVSADGRSACRARCGSPGTASRCGSTRWSAASAGPTCAAIRGSRSCRHGEEYDELRGVELSGTVEFVGEAPRTGELRRRTRRPGDPVRPQELRPGRDAPRRQTRLDAADPGKDGLLGLPQTATAVAGLLGGRGPTSRLQPRPSHLSLIFKPAARFRRVGACLFCAVFCRLGGGVRGWRCGPWGGRGRGGWLSAFGPGCPRIRRMRG